MGGGGGGVGIYLYIAFTQSHRPEEPFLDPYDKCELDFALLFLIMQMVKVVRDCTLQNIASRTLPEMDPTHLD